MHERGFESHPFHYLGVLYGSSTKGAVSHFCSFPFSLISFISISIAGRFDSCGHHKQTTITMITITLNQKTIKELLSLIANDDDVDEERRDGEVCVEQDGVEIYVAYTVYGR